LNPIALVSFHEIYLRREPLAYFFPIEKVWFAGGEIADSERRDAAVVLNFLPGPLPLSSTHIKRLKFRLNSTWIGAGYRQWGELYERMLKAGEHLILS
jgi:hypothetical protein